MMITLYTSQRVTCGTPAYHAARAEAQKISAQSRAAGKGGQDRWVDEYNDTTVRGRFVVTGRP